MNKWRLFAPAEDWRHPIEIDESVLPLLTALAERLGLRFSRDDVQLKFFLGTGSGPGLGPNFLPSTKLLVLSSKTLEPIYGLELRSSEDTLSEDVFQTVEADNEFYGDGVNDTFTLEYPPTTITAVTIDDVPETGYTISGSDIIFTTPPGEEAYIDVQYIGVDPAQVVFRADDRRFAVDGANVEILAGYAKMAGEWAVLEIPEFERTSSSPTPTATRTMLVQIPLFAGLEEPVVTVDSSTGAGYSTILKATWLDFLFDGNYKVRQVK